MGETSFLEPPQNGFMTTLIKTECVEMKSEYLNQNPLPQLNLIQLRVVLILSDFTDLITGRLVKLKKVVDRSSESSQPVAQKSVANGTLN